MIFTQNKLLITLNIYIEFNKKNTVYYLNNVYNNRFV